MKIEDDYEWSTHQPLLHLLMSFFKPQLVLELGMGIHSTPLFLSYDPAELVCVENNKEWFEHMRTNYIFKNNHTLIFHDLTDDITIGTFLHQLTEDQIFKISDYYINLAKQIEEKSNSPKLLFVDNYTCCRTLAINKMYKSFDMVVYHDCQPKGIVWYEYYFDESIRGLFTSYFLKTPRGWTGCFLNNRLIYTEDDLKNALIIYANKYCTEHRISFGQIYLEKE